MTLAAKEEYAKISNAAELLLEVNAGATTMPVLV